MILLALGDVNTPGTEEMYHKVSKQLDDLHKKYTIDKVVSFDESGVSYLSAVWAFEKDIPAVVIPDYDYDEDVRKATALPNRYLRKIVDTYKVDTFFFHFLEEGSKSVFGRNMRDFYGRAVKAFKSQRIFTNYLHPPK